MFKNYENILVALSLVTVTSTSFSEEKKPLWEVGVGLGGLRAPVYIGASQNTQRILPLPYLLYRGEIFRVDENGVDAKLLKSDNYELDLSLGAGLGGNRDKVTLRNGMPKLGPTVEIGPRFVWHVARPTKDSSLSLNLPLRAVFEFSDGLKNRGFVFEPNLRYGDENIGAGFGFVAQAGVLWGNEKNQKHYYSVLPNFSTLTRPTYNGKAGLLATRLSFALFKDVNPSLSFGGFARIDLSSNAANEKSPLHVKNSGLTIGLGLNYTFAKSSTLVSW